MARLYQSAGFPQVIQDNSQNKTNLAPASVTTTTPAATGRYRVSGYLEVTTGTVISLALGITYKTPGGNGVTDGVVFDQQGSATLLTAVVAAGRYYFSQMVSTDNSGTSIVVADNAGTYTTCVYTLTVNVERLA